MSQALYRKWRPRLWDQVVAQEHIVTTLQNAIRAGRVGHAYLFAGPRGTGKTTTARLLAKAVNCLAPEGVDRPCDQCEHCAAVNANRFMDLIEIDAASNTSVDDVRELREKINFSRTQGIFKVYIIDEVHMLSTAAFNALLKTLEEPPPHAIFILATTEVHKIPATVLSRCQRHEFRRIPVKMIVDHLSALCDQEGLKVDPETLTLIARQSTGSMRDAISLLDQLSSTGTDITLIQAQQVLGTATSQHVMEMIDAVLNKDPSAGLNCVHTALDGGSDPRQFARQVVDYLRNLLLIRMGNAGQIEATSEQRVQMAKHANQFSMAHLLETIRLFNGAASETRSGWQPGLPLELAFAQSIAYSETPLAEAPRATSQPMDAPKQPAKANEHSSPKRQPENSTIKEPTHTTEPEKKAAPLEQAAEPDKPAQVENAGPVALNTVLANWSKIRAAVKAQRKPTEALLNSCKSIQMREGRLILGFTTEVLKSKMENDDNLKITGKAIQKVLGADIPVTCVVVNPKSGSLPEDLDVEADGMVNTALGLGGKIVHKE